MMYKKYVLTKRFLAELLVWECVVFAALIGVIVLGFETYASFRLLSPQHAQRHAWVSSQDITMVEQDLAACVIDFVPDDVFETVYDAGWSLTYVDQPLPQIIKDQQITVASYADGYDIVGLAILSHKQLLVNSETSNVINATLHEIAHAYEHTVYLNTGTQLSDLPEFKQIFSQEKSQFTSYYQESVREFFAEASEMYWMHPGKLKHIAPNTFDFMQNLYGE